MGNGLHAIFLFDVTGIRESLPTHDTQQAALASLAQVSDAT